MTMVPKVSLVKRLGVFLLILLVPSFRLRRRRIVSQVLVTEITERQRPIVSRSSSPSIASSIASSAASSAPSASIAASVTLVPAVRVVSIAPAASVPVPPRSSAPIVVVLFTIDVHDDHPSRARARSGPAELTQTVGPTAPAHPAPGGLPWTNLETQETVQVVKAAAKGLREPLLTDMGDDEIFVSKDSIHILKHHGSYMQQVDATCTRTCSTDR